MIVVPRRRTKVRQSNVKGKRQSWEINDVKEPPSPTPIHHRPAPKPVDEDLYKISPHLLYAKARKKRGLSLFSSCMQVPACVL
ncbi:uncharacterized protein LOC120177211 [Hibiscus syriacus]|nr:uncharacterized protein LOC120177211 [Hibiscus syriacus]